METDTCKFLIMSTSENGSMTEHIHAKSPAKAIHKTEFFIEFTDYYEEYQIKELKLSDPDNFIIKSGEILFLVIDTVNWTELITWEKATGRDATAFYPTAFKVMISK